ncbi:MAG: hypothetical protein ACREKH_16960 [Candidatus Rokuibacteriota bacterium]
MVALSLGAAVSGVWAATPGPSLPADLPAAERARLERVAEGASVSTRVDTTPFVTRREVFEYLLDHPDFATHVTRTLRLARYRIWRTPEGMFLDDGWGATGRFAVVHATAGQRVMYARGAYRQTLLPAINGEAVAMIDYEITPTDGGRDVVHATVSGFVKLDSGFLAVAAKIAGPIAQRKADLEARRLMRTFARVSQALETDPVDVYERLRQRPDVPPRELEEFARLLGLGGGLRIAPARPALQQR